ncbi:hypothetical protein ACTWP5_31565 [Streptomyces sp. 4N509B]|uniref:hypothetical protein n=1 Tax=Streptomyces sp. 4N509B TaxID=3457413 RepID=UPI003FD51686
MPGIVARIARLARSPQGRRAVRTARRAASDPRKRARARGLLGRLPNRRRPS